MSIDFKSKKIKELKIELKDEFYQNALKKVKKSGINKKITNKIPWNKKKFTPHQKGLITKLFKETISHRFESFIPVKKRKSESNKSYRKRIQNIKSIYGQSGHLTDGVYIAIPKEIAENSRFNGINLITKPIITKSGTTIEKHIPINKEFMAELFKHIENLNSQGLDCNNLDLHDKSDMLFDKLDDYIIDVWENNKKPRFLHVLYGTGKTSLGYEFTNDTYFDNARDMANNILKLACNYDNASISIMLFNGFVAIYDLNEKSKKGKKGKKNVKRKR